VKPVKVVAR